MKTSGLPIAVALLLGSAGAAFAQAPNPEQTSEADRSVARQLTVQGLDALERKDFVAAEAYLSRAETIFWAPTIGLALARARVGLGKLLKAQEAYGRVAHVSVPPDASPAFRDAIVDAKRELGVLATRVPSVIINIKGAQTAEVTLDDAPVAAGVLGLPRPADPGRHVIRAKAPGFAVAEATVTLAEGATSKVDLEMKPGSDVPTKPEAMPSNGAASPATVGAQTPVASGSSAWTTQRTVAAWAGGAGVAGLIVGGVVGGMALGKYSDSKAQCSPGNPNFCNTAGVSERNNARSLGDASSAIMIASGLVAATGVVLWFTAPASQGPRTGCIEILPSALGADVGLGLRGRW